MRNFADKMQLKEKGLNMDEKTYKRGELKEIVGIPPRRVLFYAENDLLTGIDTKVGRGVVRNYTKQNLFELMVIRELSDFGLELSKIKKIFRELEQTSLRNYFNTDAQFPKEYFEHYVVRIDLLEKADGELKAYIMHAKAKENILDLSDCKRAMSVVLNDIFKSISQL